MMSNNGPLDFSTLEKHEGEVVVCLGAHGGVGTTALVANLASVLARTGAKVLAIDIDYCFGDLAHALGTRPSRSLIEIFHMAATTQPKWISKIPSSDTGIRLLSQSGFMLESTGGVADGQVTIADQFMIHQEIRDGMTSTFDILRESFDVILVDGLRQLNQVESDYIAQADQMVLIGTHDVPSLRGMSKRLDYLEQLSIERGDISVIINRFTKKNRITSSVVRKAIGVDPVAFISNDFDAVHRSLNDGIAVDLLFPKSRICEDILGAVRQIFGVSVGDHRDSSKRERLRRILRRR